MPKIAITMGDFGGIGPEIVLKSLQKLDCENIILIGNKDVFCNAEKFCNLKLPYDIEFADIKGNSQGEISYLCLKKACELALSGKVSAIVTAPVSKEELNKAGYHFHGQTEVIEQELKANKGDAQMLFVAGNMSFLLLTRHEALKDVPVLVKKENILNVVRILNRELKSKFNIKSPEIKMCALNPHAGENGLLGKEEIDEINPAIKILRGEGINIEGAFPADVIIPKIISSSNKELESWFDDIHATKHCVACYHDQVLPAVKSLGLENVLNVTIGLKVVRVSPSHGTAFDIAGKNIADHRSMLNAIKFVQRFHDEGLSL